jgi:hypothetical protein
MKVVSSTPKMYTVTSYQAEGPHEGMAIESAFNYPTLADAIDDAKFIMEHVKCSKVEIYKKGKLVQTIQP